MQSDETELAMDKLREGCRCGLLAILLGGLSNGLAIGSLSGVLEESTTFQRRFGTASSEVPGLFTVPASAAERLASALQLGAMAGALGAGVVADRFGRRVGVVCSAITLGLGAAVPLCSGALASQRRAEFEVLWGGRLLLGCGVGGMCQAVPLLASELAPNHLRGALDAAFQLFVALGILAAFVFNLQLASPAPAESFSDPWRAALALPLLPSVLLAVVACPCLSREGARSSSHWGANVLVSESPRWLFLQRRDRARARATLLRLRGEDEAAVVAELAELEACCEAGDAEMSAGAASNDSSGVDLADPRRNPVVAPQPQPQPRAPAWRDLLLPEYRRAVFVACMVLWLQVFTGVDILTQYAPAIYEQTGMSGKQARLGATAGLGVAGLFATAASVAVVERRGRRPLLLWGAVAMALALTALAVLLATIAPRNESSAATAAGAVVCTTLYIVAFSMSWGPVSWVVPNEVVPTRIRAKVLALGVTLNWFADYLVVATFLSARRAVGAAAVFAFYAFVCAAAWLFTWVCVDESKGRALDEPVGHTDRLPLPQNASTKQQGEGTRDSEGHGAGKVVVHSANCASASHSMGQQDNEALPLITQHAWVSDHGGQVYDVNRIGEAAANGTIQYSGRQMTAATSASGSQSEV